MNYAQNYERCCLDKTNLLQRLFIRLMSNRARAIGQHSHKIWSLKFAIDHYLPNQEQLRILDCGAWNGWFLSYQCPQIRQRIALDFDPYYAPQMRREGIEFVLADMEKGALPFTSNSLDLVVMTSTLEHLHSPEPIAREIHRIIKHTGIVFVTVPNIMKYKFHFWDDVTHRKPFNAQSLRFLFESHGFDTLELCPYNHNLFIAGNLFPERIHRFLMKFRGRALLYVGRKKD